MTHRPDHEARLTDAVAAARAQEWCPVVATLPVYELQTLLSIAIRAYDAADRTLAVPADPLSHADAAMPPRPKKAKGPARTPPKRQRVLERDKRVCYLCEEPIPEGEESLDHVVPRAKGGSNHMRNLKATHKRCNHRKGQMSLDEYRRKYPLKPGRTT